MECILDLMVRSTFGSSMKKDKEQLDEINSSKNFLIKNGINQDL